MRTYTQQQITAALGALEGMDEIKKRIFAVANVICPSVLESDGKITGMNKDDRMYTMNDMRRYALRVLLDITNREAVKSACEKARVKE